MAEKKTNADPQTPIPSADPVLAAAADAANKAAKDAVLAANANQDAADAAAANGGGPTGGTRLALICKKEFNAWGKPYIIGGEVSTSHWPKDSLAEALNNRIAHGFVRYEPVA